MVTKKHDPNTTLLKGKSLEEVVKDLHDGVCQQLVSILWELDRLREVEEKIELETRVESLKDQVRGAISELHQVIYENRPLLIDQLGLLRGFESWMLARLKPYDIQFRLFLEIDSCSLSRFVEDQVFRILQEGVNNIINHALARQITLTVTRTCEGYITFVLVDDGRGFDPLLEQTGLGLKILKERTSLVGGNLEIVSLAGGGTELTLLIPEKGVDNL